MLTRLIDRNENKGEEEDENGHPGLAFYKVISLGGRSTHLVVTSKLDGTGNINITGLDGEGFINCLSDQPCPGHCVNMDANGDDIISDQPMKSKPVTTELEIKVALESHYIPIWE